MPRITLLPTARMLMIFRRWCVLALGALATVVLLSCTQPAAVQETGERLVEVQVSPSAVLATKSPTSTVVATAHPTATSAAESLPSATATGETPVVAPPPLPHPGFALTEFFSDDFAGSGICASCHSMLADEAGKDVSIDSHWRSTVMANSAKDPVWQAKVSSEVARRPELEALIEDKCVTCHMPMAHTQSQVYGAPDPVLLEEFLDPDHPLHEAAMDGVSCTVCHQIQDRGLGETETFSGKFQIDTTTEPPQLLAFGPYPQPFQVPMANMSGFIPVQGQHVEDPGLCASCHTLFTPVIDGAGNVVGEFPEQTPYLEWEHSAYGDAKGGGMSCQLCHMPNASGGVRISNYPPGMAIAPRSPFAQHFFVGGNAMLLRLLQTNVEDMGLSASTSLLQGTLDRTLHRLQEATAQLSITRAALEGTTLQIELRVDSRAGHKLPTGYPARQVWLHVTVGDGSGQTVFESGRPQTSGGISGNDADEDATAFERHYERITSPDQVQIYEAVMVDLERQVTQTLLRSATYIKDNRLLPFGFDPATAGEDIAVRGQASLDENFVGGSDTVVYEVDIERISGAFTVSAELLYQSVSHRFVQDLTSESTKAVNRFAELFDQASRSPIVLASTERTIDEVTAASSIQMQ